MKNEVFYQTRLAEMVFGEMEVSCDSGKIDILTPNLIIEVKHVSNYKGAIGQVLVYGLEFPDRLPVVALYGENTSTTILADIKSKAKRLGVVVWWLGEIEEIKTLPSESVIDSDAWMNKWEIIKLVKVKKDTLDGYIKMLPKEHRIVKTSPSFYNNRAITHVSPTALKAFIGCQALRSTIDDEERSRLLGLLDKF